MSSAETEPGQELGWYAMRGWMDDTSAVSPSMLDDHVSYLRRLMARGELLAGGPFVGTAERLRIYRAASHEEARALVEADPYRIAGLLRYELHPWRLHHEVTRRLLTALGPRADRASETDADER